MTVYFSAAKLGFYDDALKAAYEAAGTWPSDAVAITSADHATYTTTPPAGKVLGSSGGKPAWVDAPAPPAPSLAQKAQAALNAGLTISSTSTPDIDGTYACDETAQGRFNRVYNLIQKAGGSFPNKLTALPWPIEGGSVTFNSVAEFLAVEQAVADYVLTLDLIITTGAGTLPADAVTIS